MISTEVCQPIPGTSTSRLAPKRHKLHVNAGKLTLDFGDDDDINVTGCSVQNKRGRLGTFHETLRQRQERLDSVRCQKGGNYQKLPGRRNQSPFAMTRHLSQEDTLKRALAAVRIQRAYRAHRAVNVLKDLERRILTAFDNSHDGRTVLSFLRARSAELSALSAFMSASPHISDNALVNRMAKRVSETLQKQMDRAKREEEEREARSTVVHVYGENKKTVKGRNGTRGNATSDPHADLRRRIAMMYRASGAKEAARSPKSSDASSQRNHTHAASVSKVPKLLTISEDSESASS